MEPLNPETCSSLLTAKPKADIKLEKGEQAAHSDPDSVTLELKHPVCKRYHQVRPTLAHQDKNYHKEKVCLDESH